MRPPESHSNILHNWNSHSVVTEIMIEVVTTTWFEVVTLTSAAATRLILMMMMLVELWLQVWGT